MSSEAPLSWVRVVEKVADEGPNAMEGIDGTEVPR
jgi:hypothetical protein